jgi:hypothetical protein
MAKVYDEIPEASDLVRDINRSIMDEVLAPIAEKIRENDEQGINSNRILHSVYSAVHHEIIKTLNVVYDYQLAIVDAENKEKQNELLKDSAGGMF